MRPGVLLVTLPCPGNAVVSALLDEECDIVGAVLPRPINTDDALFARFLSDKGITILPLDEMGKESFRLKLDALKPDLLLTAGCERRIPGEILAVPRIGPYNLHPSLLPKYRGNNPYFWVIVNSEEETGVTLHKMDEGFDTGPIAFSERLPLKGDETLGLLANLLAEMAGDLARRTVRILNEGRAIPGIPQPRGDFPKAPKVRESDLLLDWNMPASVNERLVRAANPYYGAVGDILGFGITVWEAETAKPLAGMKRGEFKMLERGILVACAEDAILITALGLSGEYTGTPKGLSNYLSKRVGRK